MHNFKISLQPPKTPMEIVNGMVFTITAPYDEQSVTLEINPAVDEYIEDNSSKGIEVRDLTLSHPTDETQTVSLELNKSVVIKDYNSGENAELRLMSVQELNNEDGKFYTYEFFLQYIETN